MAATKKKTDEDLETLTPPINLDGTRPQPAASPAARAATADEQQLIDDALAGRIKLPGVNISRDVAPSNPYAGEQHDPNWKPPAEKDLAAAAGDAIVETVTRTWGGPEEDKKPEAKPEEKAENVYVDRAGDGSSSRAAAPRVVPAHEANLVSPERDKAEQTAFSHIRSGYGDQRSALEKQKDAEDDVAQARIEQNKAKAEGAWKVADVADRARVATDVRATEDKAEANSFRQKMDEFSRDLADEKIEYRQSVPQTITWMIARALGSVQQGLLHLPSNQVADQIDAHIKQSLDLKKANHERKRERLGDMQKFYDLAATQSKDQNERAKLTYGYALEAAKAEAERLAAIAGTPLALAEARKVKAALDEKSAQIETTGEYGTELLSVQAGIRNHKWVQAGVEGGGAEKPSKHVYYDPIDKTYYAAESEDDKKKLAESVQVAMQIRDAAERYQTSLKKLSGVSGGFQKLAGKAELDSDDMSEARAAHIALLTDIRDANKEGGVIREGLKKAGIYEHSIISPDKMTGNADKQIDVIVDRTKNLHKVVRDVLAPVPVDRVPQRYGNAPKNVPTGDAPRPAPKVKPAAAGFVPAGAKAKGGDVKNEQPYLVGEEGPELVVPNKPGFVLTALQTAALRGAPPTKQQVDTLPPKAKTAVQRYAEKMGVAREEGGAVAEPSQAQLDAEEKAYQEYVAKQKQRGGAAKPPPSQKELDADAEEARKFTGGAAPRTDEEKQWDMQKEANDAKEAARQRRLDEEASSARMKKELEAEQARRYEEDWKEGPLKAWARKAQGGYDVRPAEEQRQRDQARAQNAARFDAKLTAAQDTWQRAMSPLVPNFLMRENLAGPRVRQPVSFERTRAEGGEVLPLYEPEGKELHQSMDGHAFYASQEEDVASARPSLAGPTPRYSKAEAPAPKAKAPPTPPARRKMTPDEMSKAADEMMLAMRSEHEARMAAGPSASVGDARACGGAMQPRGLAANIASNMRKTKRHA